MAKLVDARDLKSLAAKVACRFESGPGHQSRYHPARLPQPNNDRRLYGRVHLDPVLRGTIENVPVRVVELSVAGALLAHEGRLPITPGDYRLTFQSEEKLMRFLCRVARTSIVRLAKRPDELSVYSTGVRFVRADEESMRMLKDVIASYVIRALNEQLANARGVPPLAAYSYQTGKGNRYRRCELIDGVWRKTETGDLKQPANGFTISAEVDPDEVDLLCRTWEICTPQGRQLTQLLAQLSISRLEGIPTRRYMP